MSTFSSAQIIITPQEPQIVSDVQDLQTDVTALQSSVTTINTNITNINTDISDLESDMSKAQTDISSNSTAISALQTGKANLSGATFTGVVNVVSPTGNNSSGARKITISTSLPSGGADGDVWIVYA